MKFLSRAALALLFAVVSFAADPSGVWKTSVQNEDGSKSEIAADLTVSGRVVNGTVFTALGEMHITEGSTDGDKIHFIAEFADVHVDYKGTFTEKEMKLEVTMITQKVTLVLKKS